MGRHELKKLFKIALDRKLEIEEENRFKEEIKVRNKKIMKFFFDIGCIMSGRKYTFISEISQMLHL